MRTPAARTKPRLAKSTAFAAPSGGRVSNMSLATPDKRAGRPQGAYLLENWFPTQLGARMRAGSEKYATLGDGEDDVTALFAYSAGNTEELFGATATDIYDITTVADADVSPTAEVSGQTGGDWVSVQFATTGGIFLTLVNGEDPMRLYDGTDFYPITDEGVNALDYDAESAAFTVGETLTGGTSGATATIVKVIDSGTTGTLWIGDVTSGPFEDNEAITDGATGSATADGTESALASAITGVDTSTLSYAWAFKQRLFFVQKDTLDAWYLSVDSIAGTATKLPLGGVFSLGGSLLFGAAWSLDTGAGLSEQCVFVTTEGEVAVFQGTNPGDAAEWSKVGVYRIGRPLGSKAHIRAGGDLIIATDLGFVPLSQAIQRDVAVLSPAAVSAPIAPDWAEEVAGRSFAAWHATVWPTKQMVLVTLPTNADNPAKMFIANAETGAWTDYTGWNGKCLQVWGERCFFGSEDGKVMEAEVTGADDGTPYTATYVPLFEDLRSPLSLKTPLMARAILRGPADPEEKLSVQSDYTVNLPSAPDAPSAVASGLWGTAVWGTDVWGAERERNVYQNWRSVSGEGYALAPSIQITSGSTAAPDVDLVRIDLTYDTADIIS